ncbi:Bor/Iss family lipoprotein [Aeromonas jandaei]
MILKNKIVIIIIISAFNSGCATQAVDVNATQVFSFGKGRGVESKEITSHFFFTDIDFGLNDTIDAASICHGVENIVRVETSVSFWDSIYRGLTFGLYTPRSARVYCAA